jgi:hypothetical protein
MVDFASRTIHIEPSTSRTCPPDGWREGTRVAAEEIKRN